ncbi:response regulator transcription factor [Mucilaginibacter rubeus]|uniref:Response regulator transcription factor n=1 Tax=Mucilaginibacter rubeus TaxID=2027860 RepID=A0AAE6JH01_9SPHI|nr:MULTISPECIES: LytTR family DNA-binding domain-containing protein [Mucilaginibacter]QEM05519.1 response regulator transcription factor [Mucilaginibacter rubeus]QEM18104.1 response regulator transcription factor [Mucilaginibacter gossypii]QTE45361.1 response regulator transcription factor [Mucilaginibacter rubeus]QTE51958.1 response regulator transcription factor [Mucilaginibacter rubeus]QTE57046.1 response regulator transcription factor [Mucilaginibacter rubeus]
MMNCVIIDDEPLAREGLASYVREVDFLNLTGTCENPLELIKLLDHQAIDLIFLDIQMPKMNGIDFLKIMQKPPMVIITTAYPSYALEGFQLNVLDYLLKPITFDRFFKSANKAKDYHRLLNNWSQPGTPKTDADEGNFFIKCGNKYEKIYFDEILYVEGMQNYVTIFTAKGKYITLLNLKSLEQNLDSKLFIRVHKSYIVSTGKIDGIEGNDIFIGQHRIPISRNYREQVIRQVVANKLWDKIKFS